jgi:hypothetical protein
MVKLGAQPPLSNVTAEAALLGALCGMYSQGFNLLFFFW